MAEQTLTNWTINSILIVLLTLGLVSSFTLLVNNEGRGEIFDDYPDIQRLNLNLTNSITGSEMLETANVNSNLTADYNAEASLSGADRTGNAIAVNLQNIVSIMWVSLGVLGSLLFGSIYRGILSGLIIAITGFTSVALALKSIRTGTT